MYDESWSEQDLANSMVNLRHKSGLTQKEVEKLLGLRPLSIYDYESNRLKLPYDLLVKLCNLYQANIEEFFGLKKMNAKSNRDYYTSLLPLAALGILGKEITAKTELIFHDPVILAELGLFAPPSEINWPQKLLSCIDERGRSVFLSDLLKYMNSLIGIDQEINQDELEFKELVIKHFSLKIKPEEAHLYSKWLTAEYFSLKKAAWKSKKALTHYLIWALFILAISDGKFNYKKQAYIRKVAIHLEIPTKVFDQMEKTVLVELEKNK